MEYQLLKVEHFEYGVWYFTSIAKAAAALGIQHNHLSYYINKNKIYKGWSFEYVDGRDIIYYYINPTSII